MEIEVGEYVRTKSGIIFKVDKEKKNIQINEFMNMGGDRDIKAHSFNIIDLIEVGDYVNGFKIYGIEYTTYNNHVDLVFTTFKTPINFEEPYKVVVTWNDKDIRSILTHEQYEQNCYKIGE